MNEKRERFVEEALEFWKKAFLECNGRNPEDVPEYRNGWFCFGDPLHPYRVRPAELRKMGERLNQRTKRVA